MAKELKKIADNIDLKGLVIHQVLKDAGTRRAVPKYGKKLLSIEEKERLFIGKIYTAYFEKSAPMYGIFANEKPDFKNHLTEYIDKDDFFSFSKNAVDLYKSTIKESPPATGGFLIFAHFANREKRFDYVLVMTINNKDGYVVSEEDLSIKDIKNLDLSKVDVACMINLTKWKEIEAGTDSEIRTYLSFAKGNKDVSYYFLSFIDCDNKTTSTESTKRLTNAIDQYCAQKAYDRETSIRKRNDVYAYCIDCLDNKREIHLSAISALLDPDKPTAFEKFAASEDYGVSAIISGDRAKLKPMKFITYKDKRMTIEFDAALLKDGTVSYNSDKKQLTFKKLPDSLTTQIPPQ